MKKWRPKIGGFYETPDGFVYIIRQFGSNYNVVYVSFDKGYSEDYEVVPPSDLYKSIMCSVCFVGFRSKKYNMFYAVWDGADKETFYYLLPLSQIKEMGLLKPNFPQRTLKKTLKLLLGMGV